MSLIVIASGVLLAASWIFAIAITRREMKRRRLYPTRYLSFDDRDSLARFRRIMGR